MSSQSFQAGTANNTKSVPWDAASTYTTSTACSYEKPSYNSNTSETSFKSKTKKFLKSLGHPPTAEYDRLHPKVLSQEEQEARKLEYPSNYHASQIRGLH